MPAIIPGPGLARGGAPGWDHSPLATTSRERGQCWREAALRLWGEDGPGVRERLHTTASRARDLLADREAVVWRGETLLLDPRRKWKVV